MRQVTVTASYTFVHSFRCHFLCILFLQSLFAVPLLCSSLAVAVIVIKNIITIV